MSNFDPIVHQILIDEGLFSNDKNDHGGPTKYGISQAFLKDVGLPSTLDAIQHLTEDEAIRIYRQYFWTKYNLYKIDNQDIANKTMNLAVNMGAQTAIKLLQAAINKCQLKPIAVDGIIGKMTLNAINNVSIVQLLIEYKNLAANYYRAIVKHDPTQEKFLNGWLHRCQE